MADTFVENLRAMAKLNVLAITRIATNAAREVSADLQVAGVTLGAGGGEYAEVILNIRGCRKEPCQVALGVLRSETEPAVHAHITAKLRKHLKEHRSK